MIGQCQISPVIPLHSCGYCSSSRSPYIMLQEEVKLDTVVPTDENLVRDTYGGFSGVYVLK
jgi:hypothetical protein